MKVGSLNNICIHTIHDCLRHNLCALLGMELFKKWHPHILQHEIRWYQIFGYKALYLEWATQIFHMQFPKVKLHSYERDRYQRTQAWVYSTRLMCSYNVHTFITENNTFSCMLKHAYVKASYTNVLNKTC